MAVLVPGLKPVDPTWELYRVRAGGATVVPLGGDDRITVHDPDGAQPAELTVLAPDGREDPGALGRPPRRPGHDPPQRRRTPRTATPSLHALAVDSGRTSAARGSSAPTRRRARS